MVCHRRQLDHHFFAFITLYVLQTNRILRRTDDVMWCSWALKNHTCFELFITRFHWKIFLFLPSLEWRVATTSIRWSMCAIIILCWSSVSGDPIHHPPDPIENNFYGWWSPSECVGLSDQTCAPQKFKERTQESSMDMENYCLCHLWRLKEEITANKICVPGNREKGVQINDSYYHYWFPQSGYGMAAFYDQ